MMTFIETAKRYGGLMIVIAIIFYVCALVVLQLMAAAVEGFPKLKQDPPDPYVYHGDHPRDDKTGCVTVGGMEICPKEPPNQASSNKHAQDGTAIQTPSRVEVEAGDVSKVRFVPRSFRETRLTATQDIVDAVKLVAHVLEAETPINVYVGRFTDGPAAYARSVEFGRKYEIVFSDTYIPANNAEGRVTWPFMGLVAHEVAHTIYDEGWGEDRMSNEASAEYQAGAAIYRLGGYLKDSFEFSAYFTGTSEVHPTPGLSALLSREGWYQAKARHEERDYKCVAQTVGHSFDYKSKTCRYILSCDQTQRPIQVACESSTGIWHWQ